MEVYILDVRLLWDTIQREKEITTRVKNCAFIVALYFVTLIVTFCVAICLISSAYVRNAGQITPPCYRGVIYYGVGATAPRDPGSFQTPFRPPPAET